jgi:hypothetical protein
MSAQGRTAGKRLGCMQMLSASAQDGACIKMNNVHQNTQWFDCVPHACRHGYWVYDFALPMLLLHALKFRTAESLKHW